jgi:hypothetical protein
MNEENAITVQPQEGFLSPAISVQDALNVYQAKKQFIEGVLKPGVDFGIIPGTGTKAVLLKPGAEKMTSFFGLSTVFVDVEKVEDWIGTEHNGEPFFYYREKCELYRGERLIASADGSCNSFEKKYRYRNSDHVCPQCGKNTIIKGKEEYGGGWICFAKKGGCGAKFADNDQTIIGQEIRQVKNPDVAELVNTILKMAQKRALVAATLIATGVSDYFTQDIEDYVAPGQFIDGQARDITPPPPGQVRDTNLAPAEKKSDVGQRPYEPATFKIKYDAMVKQMEKKGEVVLGEKDAQVLASTLDAIYAGDKLKRHEFTYWLIGSASTKDMSPAQVKCLLKIMDVSGFDQPPSVISMKEIRMAHSEALRAMGQTELPLEGGV